MFSNWLTVEMISSRSSPQCMTNVGLEFLLALVEQVFQLLDLSLE